MTEGEAGEEREKHCKLVWKLRSVCEILRATNLETCTLGRANGKGSGKGDYHQFERTVSSSLLGT